NDAGRHRGFSRFRMESPSRPNTMTGGAWEHERLLRRAALKLKDPCITARRNGLRTDGSISQKAANSNSRCDSYTIGGVAGPPAPVDKYSSMLSMGATASYDAVSRARVELSRRVGIRRP